MTHISRPFQVVLVVFVLFVAVWFMALRAHNSSTTGGAGANPSTSQPVKSAATKAPAPHAATASATHAAKAPATSSTAVQHTTAGQTRVQTSVHTTRAVHGANTSAVATHSSVTTASGQTTVHTMTVHSQAAHTTTVHATAVHRSSGGTTTVHATVTHTAQAKPAPAKTKSATNAPNVQKEVESQLQAGKTVLILFWNPHGAEDVAVHNELPAVQSHLAGKVAVHYASASQVGEYGSITHAIQVNQTPTLLVVNPHGQTTVVTGLTDAFGIEQSIRESA